jgi:phytol kinase
MNAYARVDAMRVEDEDDTRSTYMFTLFTRVYALGIVARPSVRCLRRTNENERASQKVKRQSSSRHFRSGPVRFGSGPMIATISDGTLAKSWPGVAIDARGGRGGARCRRGGSSRFELHRGRSTGDARRRAVVGFGTTGVWDGGKTLSASIGRRGGGAGGRRDGVVVKASAAQSVIRYVASMDETTRDVAATALTTVGAFVWVKMFDALAKRGVFSSTLSRKLVHITSGTFYVCTWPLFSASEYAQLFAASIPIAQGLRLFGIGSGMIDNASAVRAVSRAGGKEELLKGPLYYTIVLAACSSAYWRTSPIGIVAMAMMCGGDGFADIIGRKFGRGNALPWNAEKSWAGSAGFVAGGFLISSGCVVRLKRVTSSAHPLIY